MRGLIRQSLRIFQLPIQVRSEFAACKALAHFLRRGAIRYEDSLTWTRLELNLWRESGRPSKGLRRAVQAVLSVEVSNTTAFSSAKYFSLHERLRSDHGFGHEESTAFLSHLNLAIGLVQAQRFTGARLTQVLSSIDTRVRFTRQSISQAISALGLRTEINIDQLDSVWKRDKSFEEVFFADADLSDSAEIAGEAASDLGFRGNLKTGLLFLAPVQELAKYVPYIQMLHFQCVIPEYFDHSVLDLYEFSPRGNTVGNLLERYPANLVSAGNPFLNNAKSVGTMDNSWVDSKKPSERIGARALFTLLSGIDEMNYTARRELAMIIRSWIMRFIRLSGDVATPLPETLTAEQAQQLLAFIRQTNTGSLGILEQRCLDTIASLRHRDEAWKQRGRGDAVNATNISRKKLGDCDFQNTDERQIIAYEAHGGILSSVYIQEHLHTLRKVVPIRKPELESVAPIENWRVIVRFFAHEIVADQPDPIEIDGLSIRFELATFRDLLALYDINAAVIEGLTNWFLPPLRARRTPDDIRAKVLSQLS